MPTLTIQLPGLPPVEHILRDEAITLGRMKGNTIALDDASVSLSHAKITRLGDDFILKDLNSTNGTMLNGQSISEARLRNGDQLKLGEVVAIFRLETIRPAVQPAVVPTLVPTELPPAIAHTVTNLIPTVAASPVTTKRPAPQPSSAPRPSAPSNPVKDLRPTTPSRTGKRNPVTWLAPVLGIVSATAVAGFFVWKFMSGSTENPTTTPPVSKPATVHASDHLPPGTVKKQTNATASTSERVISSQSTTSTVAQAVSNAPATPEAQPIKPALPELITMLHSPEAVARRRAAEGISSFDASTKDAVPDLREAIKDPDAEVRMWSALALVSNQVYDKTIIPILVQALRHESANARQAACISLALIPCDAADKIMVVPALAEVATKDDNENVRRDAATTLQIIAPETIQKK